MLPSIDHETGRDLLSFLSGEYTVELCGGKAWLYCTQLPADTASAAVQCGDGVLHVFLDLDKPGAYAHAREMLRTWLRMETCEMDRAIAAIIEGAPR
jgi:hypothetical protein